MIKQLALGLAGNRHGRANHHPLLTITDETGTQSRVNTTAHYNFY